MEAPAITRRRVGALDAAFRSATAAPAKADAAQHGGADDLAVNPDADGLDVERMEHERQSRLRRWQRQQDER